MKLSAQKSLKTFSVTAALLLTGSAGFAQCVALSATDQFFFLQQANAPYLMVHGSITPDEDTLPTRRVAADGTQQSRSYDATFEGKKFDGADFNITVSLPLTVAENCLAGVCGELQSGTEGVFILRDIDGAYQFSIDGCGFFGDYEPSEELLSRYKSCARDGC